MEGVEVSFAFSGSVTDATVVPATATTDADGTATTVVTSGSTPGSLVVQGTAEAVTSKSVTITVIVVDSLDLSVSTDTLTRYDTSVVTATIQDASGQPIAGKTIDFSLDPSSPTGASVDASAVTDATGTATATVRPGTEVGTALVAASVDGLQKNIAVTMVLPPVVTLTNAISPASLSLHSTATVTAVVGDVAGNPIAGKEVAFIIVSAPSGTTVEVSATTDATGQATATLTTGSAVGAVTVEASADGLTQDATATIPIPSSTVLSISALPTHITRYDTATLTAVLTDGSGNPVVGAVVAFDLPATPGGTTVDAGATTDATGTATVTIRPGGTTGTITARATVGILSQQANVTLELPPVVTLTVSGAPSPIDRYGTATVSAVAVDGQGNEIVGKTIQFTLVSKPSGTTLDATSATTDTSGTATVTLTPGTAVGTAQVEASVDGQSGTGSVELILPNVTALTVTALPTSMAPDSTSTLTAVVQDSHGNAVLGKTVDFSLGSASPVDASIDASGVTNFAGSTTATIRSGSTAGTITAKASVDGQQASADVTVAVATAASLSVAIQPAEITLHSQAVITALILDTAGQPIAGKTIDFSLDPSSPTGASVDASAVTDATGATSATITPGTAVGTIKAIASVDGLTDSGTVSVILASSGSIAFVSASPTLIGVTGSGLPETSTVTFEVRDQAGELVADGTTVTFELVGPGGGESLLETTATTVAGQAPAVVTSGTVSGALRVIASVTLGGNVFETSSDNITVGSGPAAGNHVSLARVPINIAGRVRFGETATITFFGADRFSNFIPQGSAPAFFTEGGGIEPQGLTGVLGSTSVTLQSQEPTLADGVSDVLAYIVGEESFVDVNGNGRFDFTDTNGNGIHDPGEASEPFFDTGEPYIDQNGNGKWDGDDPDTSADEAAVDQTGDRTFDGAAGGVGGDFNTSCPVPGMTVPVNRGYFFDLNNDGVFEVGDLNHENMGTYDPGSGDVLPDVAFSGGAFVEGNAFVDANSDCTRQANEPFTDPSGDGRFLAGVDYTDLDANDQPDANEAFIQEVFFDGEQHDGRDGAYDGPNGSWDDRLFVSTHTTVTFSGPTTVVATPTSIHLDPGESATVFIYVGDDQGHALASGSKVTIGKASGSVGQMVGTGTFDILDGSGTRFSVAITNNVSAGGGGAAAVTVSVDAPNGSVSTFSVATATLVSP